MVKRKIKRILTTAERRKRIRRRRLFMLVAYLLLFILIIVGIIMAIRTSYFRIQEVTIHGLNEDKKPQVDQFVKKELSGNKLLFIPKDEILLYNTEGLQSSLLNNFSFIQNATVTKEYPHNLAIEITDRTPDALYCGIECYYIDSTGLIYSKALGFSSDVYITYVDENKDQSVNPILTNLIDVKSYNQIKSYVRELELLGLLPYKITILSAHEIKIENSNNGYILISLDSPFEETAQNIKTVFIEGVNTFEYVDVRYGNKIFYKN